MRSASLKKLASTSLVAAAMLVLTASSAFATHFRYGTITWTPVPGSRTINFQVTTSWRMSYYTTNLGHPPYVGEHIRVYNSGTGTLQFCFGDATACVDMNSVGPVLSVVTSVNSTEDWLVVTTTLSHTYSANGNYTAYFRDCCRLSGPDHSPPGLLQNNGDDYFNVQSLITVSPVTPQNHPPTTSILPMVTVPYGFANTNFQILAFDPDIDRLTYRVASAVEQGGPYSTETQPPGFLLTTIWASCALTREGPPRRPGSCGRRKSLFVTSLLGLLVPGRRPRLTS